MNPNPHQNLLATHWISFLLLCVNHGPVASFAPIAAPSISPRREHRHGRHSIPRPGRHNNAIIKTAIHGTASLSATAEETSSELLRILQQKTASKNEAAVADDQINALVRTLIASKSSFDPIRCIDGPLFASVHFIGDTPLWEKIGGAAGVRNIKGQKYTLSGGTSSSSSSGTFVNYAEVLGENFYLKAFGNCKDEGPVPSVESSTDASEAKSSSNNNPLGALISLFNPGNADGEKQRSTAGKLLLPTPYDYSATVTGASIVVFRKFSLDLSIEGTGTVRVLYADENLRIFLSPTDTNVTKGGGDWESEGLVVVQVRVDLVYDDWVDGL